MAGFTKEIDEFSEFLSNSNIDKSVWNKQRKETCSKLQACLEEIIMELDDLKVPSEMDSSSQSSWRIMRRKAITRVQNELARLDKLVVEYPEK